LDSACGHRAANSFRFLRSALQQTLLLLPARCGYTISDVFGRSCFLTVAMASSG